MRDTETTDKPNIDELWSENDARTWNDRERKVYDVGHKEGESCEGAGWTLMLDEAFDIVVDNPTEAKAALHSMLIEAENRGGVRELERLRQFHGAYIGIDGKRVDDMVSHRMIDDHICELTNKQEGA